MSEKSSSFLLKGLTQEHKDFLCSYAQREFGSPSRTKAILALIDNAMSAEHNHDELINEAIEKREHYIKHHQEKIKAHNAKINEAKKEKNHELAKNLSQIKISLKKKRIQLSIPIYDYEFLENLANNSNSSIQYYIVSIIIKHLYNEKLLLGNEIELLKKSNYQLFKIGVNINQIAKANNVGDMVELPIKNLYGEIKEHIEIVKKLLNKSVNIQ